MSKDTTIRDLFLGKTDCYTGFTLTNNYSVYIECLNDDWVSIYPLKLGEVKHLMIELNGTYDNDYCESIHADIIDYLGKEVTLDTTIYDLKNIILDLCIKKAYDNETE